MNKLKMQTGSLAQMNVSRIQELFPNCVAEVRDDDGRERLAVDFDLLRQELSEYLIDGNEERFSLNWPGKRKALLGANSPISKTLRPLREKSVNFDETQNLFIEGDNLEALKLLQETYLHKVKMIYIDPPYNTGNDFVYSDNFSVNIGEYIKQSNQEDDSGNRLVSNVEGSGRFHSNWLSMMYSRLKLAFNLLRDDGFIFISIDDNEMANLKKICDEIFGAESFEGMIIPVVNPGGRDYKQIAVMHEYVLVYSKSSSAELNEIPKEAIFTKQDGLGGFEYRELRNRNPKFHSGNRPNLFYPFFVAPNISIDGHCAVSLSKDENHTIEVRPYNSAGKESVWRWGKDKAGKNIVVGDMDLSQIHAKQKSNGEWNIYEKNRRSTSKVKSIWSESLMRTEDGTRQVRALFGKTVFDHPKPLDLVKRCVQIGSAEDDIVLDFFAGSGTTAHAVLKMNSEDGGNRRFILIQLPEKCAPDTEAAKENYKTISDLSIERIKRASKQIIDSGGLFEEWNGDVGFRVLAVDSSNMEDTYYSPDSISQDLLSDQIDNVKEGRTSEDLLFQVLLDLGVDLSLPVEKKNISGREVFFVDKDALVGCFDQNGGIDENFVKELAEIQPLRVVFRDAGFKSDNVKINVEQIFKSISPGTEVKTI